MNTINNKESRIQTPKIIQTSLNTASSIVFPTGLSRIIDGQEYILVVINQYSNNSNPTGQCGAGEEGTLYILNIKNHVSKISFSRPVQSCLNLIYLESHTGAQSPYASITWSDAPLGIKILLEYYSGEESIERIYRFKSGQFILSTPHSRKY